MQNRQTTPLIIPNPGAFAFSADSVTSAFSLSFTTLPLNVAVGSVLISFSPVITNE